MLIYDGASPDEIEFARGRVDPYHCCVDLVAPSVPIRQHLQSTRAAAASVCRRCSYDLIIVIIMILWWWKTASITKSFNSV